MKIRFSKLQPFSRNQRRDFLISLINMSLVLRLPCEIHLSADPLQYPAPALLKLLQTISWAHNPLQSVWRLWTDVMPFHVPTGFTSTRVFEQWVKLIKCFGSVFCLVYPHIKDYQSIDVLFFQIFQSTIPFGRQADDTRKKPRSWHLKSSSTMQCRAWSTNVVSLENSWVENDMFILPRLPRHFFHRYVSPILKTLYELWTYLSIVKKRPSWSLPCFQSTQYMWLAVYQGQARKPGHRTGWAAHPTSGVSMKFRLSDWLVVPTTIRLFNIALENDPF